MPHSSRSIVLLVLAIMVAAGAIWFAAATQRKAAHESLSEAQASEALLLAMLNQETGLRSYVLTGDPRDLAAFHAGERDLADAQLEVAEAILDEDEVASSERQGRLAARWHELAIATIRAVPASGPRAALGARQSLLRRAMDDFRAENARLQAIVEAEGEHKLRRAGIVSSLLIGGVSLLIAVGGLGFVGLDRRSRGRRRELEEERRDSQSEFAETMQITRSEAEAHDLVRRHLERSIPESSVVVLNRNNSRNRLEAATELAAGSSLAGRLVDAAPQSCLSARLGRPHESGGPHEPLLACDLCGDLGRTTCVPSLVGGEVIGSVLVSHEGKLGPDERGRIADSVSQAAPVLANLRNLAIAEIRAATDALTGLPNARALRDNLKRMVAQASRSEQELAVIMCDLDHFKEINDVYGHEKGDEALAAAAAAIRDVLRESDLAGRYGGEEFQILLPDTPLEGALALAEKLRHELEITAVPGVERGLTASFGVSVFPADSPDGEMLVRKADRALYAAKAQGRNRVISAAGMLAAASS